MTNHFKNLLKYFKDRITEQIDDNNIDDERVAKDSPKGVDYHIHRKYIGEIIGTYGEYKTKTRNRVSKKEFHLDDGATGVFYSVAATGVQVTTIANWAHKYGGVPRDVRIVWGRNSKRRF